jgi:hypothetical protein
MLFYWYLIWYASYGRIECLTASVEVSTVLGSILASSDIVESGGRQMKQFQIVRKNYKFIWGPNPLICSACIVNATINRIYTSRCNQNKNWTESTLFFNKVISAMRPFALAVGSLWFRIL